MCGIISYVGPRNATEIVLNGLKKLEYRGYDSWGIAAKCNPNIMLAKKVGKISEVALQDLGLPAANVAMGHTRWATHGNVTEVNAHPHISNNKKIVAVHNGIIENYQAQKDFLESQGFKFYSQTDTEAIPNTIEYHMRKGHDFVEACKHSLKHLEGQFAIVILHEDENKLVAIRKEAPLVVGIGNSEFFVASDIPAFLEYTKQIIFLEEKDMAIISNNAVQIFNLISNSVVERPISKIEWDAEQARKGEFDHFFIKEISEQASVIERAVNIDAATIQDIANEIRNARGTYLVGCGTASHACLYGSYLFSKVANLHTNFCLAHEFPNFKHFLKPESLVIAISQSGETADTLAAIRAAKAAGAKTISITNVMGSTLARESYKTILQRAGPEICVLSTKAYTSQLAILTLLAYELAGKLEEGREKLYELIRYIYYLTSANTKKYIANLAEKLRYASHLFLIGRGLQYPTALEAALKVKEVSYIHAEAFAGGELKHGVIALIEHGTPCVVFTSKETEKDILSNAAELKARGAYIIGVGPNNNNLLFDTWIKVREAEEANSICQIVPMQLLAYQLALLRGCDPDKPRNLAKSVTVK